jgi:hypothetical protein
MAWVHDQAARNELLALKGITTKIDKKGDELVREVTAGTRTPIPA